MSRSVRLHVLLSVFLVFAMSGAAQVVVVGSGSGMTDTVKVFDNGGEVNDVAPYGTSATGVTVAHGDVNGDGFPDLIIGTQGSGTGVKVLNGATNAPLHSFSAFDPESDTVGVFVASGDVNGDGLDDIIAGAGTGGEPRVRIFHGGTGAMMADFLAYPSNFTGGVRVGAADFDNDKLADVITGTGPGTAAHVKVFNGLSQDVLGNFLPFGSFSGGLWVAGGKLSSPVDGDIVLGKGPGFAPIVSLFSLAGTKFYDFYAFAPETAGGVRVGVTIDASQSLKRIIAATGEGPTTTVRTFNFNWPEFALDDTFIPFGSAFKGGAFVGGFDTKPTATIAAQGVLCPHDAVTVELTGRAPWVLHWSDGYSDFADASPHNRTLYNTGTYSILKVNDATHATGRTDGSVEVSSDGGPVFTTHPQEQIIESGASAVLTAATSTPAVFFWYRGNVPGQHVELNDDFATSDDYNTGPLTQTTRYYAVAHDSECVTYSAPAMVHVRPLAPTGVVAAATSSTTVSVSWTAVAGAASYTVSRSTGGAFVNVGGVVEPTTTFTHTGVAAGTAALYRVVAKTLHGVPSAPSASDLATTVMFTDPTLTAGTTLAKAIHVTQLRTAVNAVRSLAGLPAATYTNASVTAGTRVRAANVTELRTAITQARTSLGLPAMAFINPTLTVGTTIRRVHISELRGVVQ
jgi:hypothetical protein